MKSPQADQWRLDVTSLMERAWEAAYNFMDEHGLVSPDNKNKKKERDAYPLSVFERHAKSADAKKVYSELPPPPAVDHFDIIKSFTAHRGARYVNCLITLFLFVKTHIYKHYCPLSTQFHITVTDTSSWRHFQCESIATASDNSPRYYRPCYSGHATTDDATPTSSRSGGQCQGQSH